MADSYITGTSGWGSTFNTSGGGAPYSGPPVTIPAQQLSQSARTSADQFTQKVIGRSIPIVVGTGPVAGMPVYGGQKVITTVTQDARTYEPLIASTYVPGQGFIDNGLLGVAQTYTQKVETFYEVGYLLATNPFGDPYSLLRLEVDNVVVFDAENGIAATMPFRFYDGLQTTIDPIVSTYVPTNPGANTGDILVFLPKAVNANGTATSPPTVRAIISSTASVSEGVTTTLKLADGSDDTIHDSNLYGPSHCSDPLDRVLYQTMTPVEAGTTNASILTINLATGIEARRCEIQHTCSTITGIVAVNGTGLLVGNLDHTHLALVDTTTGEVIALDTGTDRTNTFWLCAFQSTGLGRDLIMLAGVDNNNAIVTPIIDTAAATVTNNTAFTWGTGSNERVSQTGRDSSAGPQAFFAIDFSPDSKLYAVQYDGSGFSTVLLRTEPTYSGTGTLYYDAGTGLIAWFFSGDAPLWHLTAIQPVSGAVVYDHPVIGNALSSADTYWATPGYVALLAYAPSDTATITIASPAVITWVASGVTVGKPVSFSTSGFLPTGMVDGTIYYVKSIIDADNFTISATPGGAEIDTTGTQLGSHTGTWEPAGYYNQLVNISTGQVTIAGASPGTNNTYIQSIAAMTYLDGGTWQLTKNASATAGAASLQLIITKVMSLMSYVASELTFEGFDALTCYGFVIDQDTTGKAVLQSLADIYDFAFCDTGVGYFFKKPGQDGALTIDGTLTQADLAFVSGGSVTVSDQADIRTLSKLNFEFIAKANGYQTSLVSDDRPTGHFDVTDSIREQTLSIPLVDTDADMQARVTAKLYGSLTAQRTESFASHPGFAHYLPGYVLSVPVGAEAYIVVLDKVTIGGDGKVSFEAHDFLPAVSANVSSVSNTPAATNTDVQFATQYIHLDVPLLTYGDDLGGAFLLQYGVLAPRGQTNWPGGVLLAGDSETGLSAAATQAPFIALTGITTDVLAAPALDFTSDDVSTVTIRIGNGDTSLLVSATEAEVLTGKNFAFIGAPGRWEGVGYKTVTDNGDGSFTLSGFTVRGWRGSEVWEASHAAGDTFVLMNSAWTIKFPEALTTLNSDRFYKAIGYGDNAQSGVERGYLTTGTAERPYAPVNLGAVIAGSDIALSWDYRSRLSAWEFFSASPDCGEATLAFEIDIMNGATVLRTLTATTNAKTYLAGDITADFGSMPATLKFRVYMMSATVGRGYRSEATITL